MSKRISLIAIIIFAIFVIPVNAKECIPVYKWSLSDHHNHDLSMNDAFSQVVTAMQPFFVYLDLTLSDEQVNDIAGGPDEMNRIYFFTKGDVYNHEYLIHLPKGVNEFGFSKNEKKLKGFFEFFNVNGPRQGTMSVNLRPFTPTIKKCY